MAATFQLQIVTQERVVYEGRVVSIVAPGEDGYVGVLAHHAPLLTTLGDGRLTIKGDGPTQEYHLTGGFLEVHDNRATLLADSLEAFTG